MFTKKFNDAAEQEVFQALRELNAPKTVPDISIHMKEKYSDYRLYSLLESLKGQNHVSLEEVPVDMKGKTFTKKLWSIIEQQ